MMDHKKQPHVSVKDQPEVEMAPGVFRKVAAYSDELMVCHIRMLKGAVVAEHSHPHAQISCVVSGRVRGTAYGKTVEAVADDSFYFAPNEPHAVEVLEDSLLYDVFTPMREDFVK